MRKVKHERVSAWRDRALNPDTLLRVRGIGLLAPGCGSGDRVTVFKSGSAYFVLCKQTRFPYAGVSHFVKGHGPDMSFTDYETSKPLKAHSPAGEVFAQGSEQMEEMFGARWEDLSDQELVKIGLEYT